MDQDEKNVNNIGGSDENKENSENEPQQPDSQDNIESNSPESDSIENTKVFKVTLPDENDLTTKDGAETPDAPKDETGKDTKKPKKKSVLRAVIYSTCIVVVSFLLAFLLLFAVTDYMGMFRTDKTADITIPNNATASQVATILKDNGIIRSTTVFNLYTSFSSNNKVTSGVFTLNSQMSYAAIMKKLKNSDNRSTVKVTIPEGYTLNSIGDLLEKDKVCAKKDFLASCNSDKISFDFQSQIPKDKNRFYRLEGYLFPDTYEFYLGSSSDTVVKKMLTNFDNRFDDALRAKAKSSGMTVDQIVTLASIIQKEAGKTSEMSMVSSVFHNRLEKGVNGVKLLQSDATVFYGTNIIEPVTSKDSAQSDAYNSYKHPGLTPGAICNPGIAAIKAAISPDKTSYYFFVSDKNGDYYYAQTYAKHLRNVKLALSTGKADGTNVTK
jgi:UPF0755 protein